MRTSLSGRQFRRKGHADEFTLPGDQPVHLDDCCDGPEELKTHAARSIRAAFSSCCNVGTWVLTLGLRYEYNTPKSDTEGRTFSIIPGEQSQVFVNAPVGMVFPGDPGAPRGTNFPDKTSDSARHQSSAAQSLPVRLSRPLEKRQRADRRYGGRCGLAAPARIEEYRRNRRNVWRFSSPWQKAYQALRTASRCRSCHCQDSWNFSSR